MLCFVTQVKSFSKKETFRVTLYDADITSFRHNKKIQAIMPGLLRINLIVFLKFFDIFDNFLRQTDFCH